MRWINPILQDIILFISAAAVCTASLKNGFVGDDLVYFIGNKTLSTFDVRTIVVSGAIGVDYCPLRDISLAIDYLLWGEDPFGFHLTNLVLYGITVVAIRHLFAEMRGRLADRSAPASLPENSAGVFLAALLFAVHPVHSEVVYAANNRGIILAGLFFVLSCLCFSRYLWEKERNAAWYAGSLLLFIAAILSKEYSITLPLVLVLLITCSGGNQRARRLLETIPFFLISAVCYAVFTSFAVSARFIEPASENLISGISSKLVVALEIMAYYLFRIINAEGIGTFIEQNTRNPELVLLIIALFILAAVAVAATTAHKKYPQIWFGLVLYLILLVPFLNIFKTYPIVADRFAYLPSIGLFFCTTAVSFQRNRFFVTGITSIVVTWLAIVSVTQTVHWRDNVSYWRYIVEREPSLRNYSNLGMAYLDEKNTDMAHQTFRKALQYAPGKNDTGLQGDLFLMLGQDEKAIHAYLTLLDRLRSNPDASRAITWQLFSNLSKAYRNTGASREAIQYIKKAIQLKPDSAGLYNSLGVLYADLKQYDLAITAFSTAMLLDAAYGFAPLNLARTYWEIGDRAQSENYLRIVRSKFPALRADADLIGSKGK